MLHVYNAPFAPTCTLWTSNFCEPCPCAHALEVEVTFELEPGLLADCAWWSQVHGRMPCPHG